MTSLQAGNTVVTYTSVLDISVELGGLLLFLLDDFREALNVFLASLVLLNDTGVGGDIELQLSILRVQLLEDFLASLPLGSLLVCVTERLAGKRRYEPTFS